MQRDVLQSILKGQSGLAEKSGVFRVPTEHRVTFYLGTDGRGLVVNEVDAIRLLETHVALATRESGEVYCEYEMVHALSIKAPKENAPKRAGFL